ncbi:aminoacyl-tRNA hydrolase [Gudongella sp. DL1XJH-153]|uniref:aminoacyl-tRNA hydrolase n=1 Tax=Gudongella sp. DL1XJH-153 TaxID=3409804 RepID=UPI003BB6C0BF
MIVIAGLGNPGSKYSETRHNIGFNVVDRLAQANGIKVNKLKFKALIGEGFIGTEKVLLVKPSTFMNNSGQCIREIVEFYKLPPGNLLVVVDDIDIEFATIRIKKKGSAGSHNGLKSIIYQLQVDDFPRIKVGIGKKPHYYDLADFVLSKFSSDERKLVDQAIKKAAEAAEEFVKSGIDKAMNKFNVRNAAQD